MAEEDSKHKRHAGAFELLDTLTEKLISAANESHSIRGQFPESPS